MCGSDEDNLQTSGLYLSPEVQRWSALFHFLFYSSKEKNKEVSLQVRNKRANLTCHTILHLSRSLNPKTGSVTRTLFYPSISYRRLGDRQ